MSLPTADDLFRPTAPEPGAAAPSADADPAVGKPQDRGPRSSRSAVRAVPEPEPEARKAASGRIRHDEKMTVYVTTDELMDIEQARLTLRARHGLAVDRGRLVREAVALVLEELDEHGAESLLVRRLTEE